jgi:two-component system CheB/CheR fusion protein
MLKRMATEQDEIVHPYIAVRIRDASQYVTLRGHWVPAIGKTPNLAMLCFETTAADPPWCKAKTKGMALHSRQHIESLEQRLQHTQTTLQSTFADLQSRHADLQCRHDELLASHVELRRTHETLQAANEVLYTVNVEHRNKLAELTRLSRVGDLAPHR